jgi:hypothetical protein
VSLSFASTSGNMMLHISSHVHSSLRSSSIASHSRRYVCSLISTSSSDMIGRKLSCVTTSSPFLFLCAKMSKNTWN